MFPWAANFSSSPLLNPSSGPTINKISDTLFKPLGKILSKELALSSHSLAYNIRLLLWFFKNCSSEITGSIIGGLTRILHEVRFKVRN